MALNPGDLLNHERYRIVGLVGSGGFGAVYKAKDLNFGESRHVAIKENLLITPQAREQFKHEANLLVDLNHPNLPRVTDFLELPGGGQYMVMDFIAGQSLQALLEARDGPLAETEVVPWIGQVASALQYLHSRTPPIIHRDVKPANIILTAANQVFLVDFGIAKTQSGQTAPGAKGATAGYAPPEQYDGTTERRSDVYSLGATLYALLTGEAPPRSTERSAGKVELWPPHQLNPSVRPDTSAAILWAMRLRIDERPASVAALMARLPAVPAPSPPPAKADPERTLLNLNVEQPRENTLPHPPAAKPVTPPASRPKAAQPAPNQQPAQRPGAQALFYLIPVLVVLLGILGLWYIARPWIQNDVLPTPTIHPQPTTTPTPKAADARTVLRGGVPVVQVFVPAGSFPMGEEEGEPSEQTAHMVALNSFWLDRTEVTNAQFAAFVENTGHTTTAEIEGGGMSLRDGGLIYVPGATWSKRLGPDDTTEGLLELHPVTLVSWTDAAKFCAWSGGRLPTEAEWEYAARGPGGWLFPWGDSFDPVRLNSCDSNCDLSWAATEGDDGYAFTAPAGAFIDGASWAGALDMSGNVWEWANDWSDNDYYATSETNNPRGPVTGSLKVLRGGSWYQSEASWFRTTQRYANEPLFRALDVGFRCVHPEQAANDAISLILTTTVIASTLQPEVTTTPTLTPTITATATATPTPNITGPTPAPIPAEGEAMSPENAGRVAQLMRWGPGVIEDIAYSPDGRLLAAATASGVYLHDIDSHLEIAFFATDYPVDTFAFDPSGERMAVGLRNGTVELWRMPDGELLATTVAHTERVMDLAFGPSGELLVTGSWDDTARLWNTADNELASVHVFPGHEDGVWSVAFSPDGQWITSGAGDGTIYLREAAGGALRHNLSGHTDNVWGLAFSPDGQMLASASTDQTVRLWRIPSGEILNTLTAHDESVLNVAFSPDGETLASGSDDDTIRLWQVDNGALVHTLTGHRNWINHISFAPDGETLASASSDGTIRFWDPTTGTQTEIIDRYTSNTELITFSPDGRMVASAGQKDEVWIWSTDGGPPLRLTGHTAEITDISFSPDGALLASASEDKTVRLWNTTNGVMIAEFDAHTSFVLSVAFSPDGQLLASGGADETVRLWAVNAFANRGEADSEPLRTLTGHTNWIRQVAFSPNGALLASASDDNTVGLWRTSDGELLLTLSGHTDWVRQIAFSPDSALLASVSDDDTIRLWRTADGAPLRVLSGHTARIRDIAFSPDGIFLASASDDETVQLFHLGDGQLPPAPFTPVSTSPSATPTAAPPVVLANHQGVVTGLAFSPDSRLLASSSTDWSVRLWNVDDGQQVAMLTDYAGRFWNVAFSPDGRLLASVSDDGILRLWGVPATEAKAP